METQEVIIDGHRWRIVLHDAANDLYNADNLVLMPQSQNSSKGGFKEGDSLGPQYIGPVLEEEDDDDDNSDDLLDEHPTNDPSDGFPPPGGGGLGGGGIGVH